AGPRAGSRGASRSATRGPSSTWRADSPRPPSRSWPTGATRSIAGRPGTSWPATPTASPSTRAAASWWAGPIRGATAPRSATEEVMWLVYRRRLPPALPAEALDERGALHHALMIKTMAAVAVMLVAFLAGVPIALVAIGGAAYCLLTRRVNPDKVYPEIDCGTLVLFTGLLVVIGGLEASGLAGEILGWAGAAGLYRPSVLTVVTAVLSNLVSNVPAVLLFKTVIPTFGEPTRAWLLLAIASTLAGNLTTL